MGMPDSAAVMFAFPSFEALKSVCARLGVAWVEPDSDEDGHLFDEGVLTPLTNLLEHPLQEAHLKLIREQLDPDARSRGEYTIAKTSHGPRELSVFGLELWGDPYERGDRWPQDFCYGVPLSSRYFPTWIDWEENGTDGTFRLNAETQRLIDVAREALLVPLPEIADAEVVSKVMFY